MKIPKILQPLVCHGVEFIGESGDQLYGLCPFCSDEDHFYANTSSGLWDCKKCGRSGNVATFLEQTLEFWEEQTTAADYRRVRAVKGIATKTLKRFNLTYNGTYWLLPHQKVNERITDLRRWREGTHSMLSTKGGRPGLFGLQHYDKDAKQRTWICEGEWDTMILQELFWKLGLTDELALGVPGADIFKNKWVELFQSRQIILVYDNDDPGDRGSKKAAKLLQDTASEVTFVWWPETCPSGWDLRDYILAAKDDGFDANQTFRSLRRICHRTHRHDKPESNVSADEKKLGITGCLVLPKEQRPSFQGVLQVFRKQLFVDQEIVDALLFVLAIIVSEQLPGPPVWAHLVGPPGAAKTLLIMSAQDSDRVIYRSTLNARSMVSGYRTPTGEDPSIFAELNGKTLAIKDGTEFHAGPQWQVQETDAVLRGAYDGFVSRSYGNNVLREYTLHFSIIIGTTTVVYAMEQSALGERFIRFRFQALDEEQRKSRIVAAAKGITHKVQVEELLKPVVRDFLAFDVERLPPVPDWFYDKLASLCELIAVLRATVARDFREQVQYHPEPEYGTRIAQQLTKLAMAVSIVKDTYVIDRGVWNFVRRLGLDTATPWHWEIVRVLAKHEALIADELYKWTGIPRTTLGRRLNDLELLRVIKKVRRHVDFDDRKTGGPSTKLAYALQPWIRRWLEEIDYVAPHPAKKRGRYAD